MVAKKKKVIIRAAKNVGMPGSTHGLPFLETVQFNGQGQRVGGVGEGSGQADTV